MTDLNGTGEARRTDELIDRVVARRAARGTAGAPATAATRPGPEEALITELSGLTPIDWPADEAGDRIAGAVAAAASPPAAVRRPGRAWRAVASCPRPPRRWVAVAAAVATALLVAGMFQLTGGSRPAAGPGGRTGPASSPAGRPPRAGEPSSVPSRPAGTGLTAMRVVAGPAALRSVGVAGVNDNFLTCVSGAVCYVLGSAAQGGPDDIARSVNGGVSWTSGEPLPARGTAPYEFTAALSCPRSLTCFTPYGTSLLKTTDGFAHYAAKPVRMPALRNVSLVSCPTTRDCVAAVQLSGNRQAFAYSHDGGASWAEGHAPALGRYDIIGGLRCDRGGTCIAALVTGTAQDPGVAAVASADGGRSWTVSRSYSMVNMQQYMVSCGDGQDCLVGSNDGYLAWVHASGSGPARIRVRRFPRSWNQQGSALGCASARDCFVATGSGALEATRDGGRTWAPVPAAPAAPQRGVSYMSCPVPAGCVALVSGVTGDGSEVVLSNLRSSR